MRKISLEKEERIADMLLEGYTQEEIRTAVGCGTKTITLIRRRMGVTNVRHTYKTLDRGKICALYKARWSLKDIAGDVSCSIEDVVKILAEEGVCEVV